MAKPAYIPYNKKLNVYEQGKSGIYDAIVYVYESINKQEREIKAYKTNEKQRSKPKNFDQRDLAKLISFAANFNKFAAKYKTFSVCVFQILGKCTIASTEKMISKDFKKKNIAHYTNIVSFTASRKVWFLDAY